MGATIWKGHLTFGLVSIPVKLVRAARAEKIHMHRLQRGTGERVRQVFVPASGPVPEEMDTQFEPEPTFEVLTVERQGPVASTQRVQAVPQPDLVSGFEFEKGHYVEFEKQPLENLAPKASSEMQFLEFVRFADVDAVYLESSYYVVPDTGGGKPYALLFEALKKSGYAAITEFVMHRRDQTMILRPGSQGIIGHTLFYEDEVLRENEFHADPGQTNPKEMDLAMKLVDALAAPFEPGKYKDHYRERLQQAISEKIQTAAVVQPQVLEAKAPVIDIMAALKQSLQQAKRPAAREDRPVSQQRQKRSATRKQA